MAKLSSERELILATARIQQHLRKARRKPEHYEIVREALMKRREERAAAHVAYRRALERARSLSVQVAKKHRPDVMMGDRRGDLD